MTETVGNEPLEVFGTHPTYHLKFSGSLHSSFLNPVGLEIVKRHCFTNKEARWVSVEDHLSPTELQGLREGEAFIGKRPPRS